MSGLTSGASLQASSRSVSPSRMLTTGRVDSRTGGSFGATAVSKQERAIAAGQMSFMVHHLREVQRNERAQVMFSESLSRLRGVTSSRRVPWMGRTACVLAVVLLVLGAVQAQPAITKAQWSEDVAYFAREMPRRHKNLFHATPREQFERSVAELTGAIPSLSDHQIIVKLMQIAARVGDGHTGVNIPTTFKRYPLAVSWFG